MSWRSLPLGALFERIEERGRPDLPLLSVYRDLGVVPRAGRDDNFNRPSDDLASYKVVRPGDLVLNKMKTWQGSLGVSDYEGIVSPAYFIGRARPAVTFDRRFLHHLVRSGPMIAEYGARSKGIRPSQWDLPWDEFKSIRISLPEQNEQRAIADYLDAETARIDALFTKKRRMIELLEEKIDASVLIEMERNGFGDTSGVPLSPVRRQLAKLARTPKHGAEMVTAFRDGQVTTRLSRRREGYTESWTEASRVQGVNVGDVVIHGLDGFAGAIGHAETDGVCSPVYHVCEPTGEGEPAFLGRLLRVLAVTGYLSGFAISTRERAVDFRNWDLFGRIPIPIVAIERQRQIASWIDHLAPLKIAIAKSEQLAAERKQGLITAAVTGELDIPGVAA